MQIRFDHLVVAARALDEGVAWAESRLGVPMGPGGKHELMGTHNRLLSLGPGRFLEVIAIDPEAPPPGRPRWFDLDSPSMQERLARAPALVTWVVRTGDIEAAVKVTAGGKPDILALSRGAYRWRIGVPPSGALAQDGCSPTVIQWAGAHPGESLPDVACRMERLVLRHPEAPATLQLLHAAGLDPVEPIEAHRIGQALLARIRTPRGIVEISADNARE